MLFSVLNTTTSSIRKKRVKQAYGIKSAQVSTILAQQKDKMNAIKEIETVELEKLHLEVENTLFEELKESQRLVELTNFTEAQIMDLYADFHSYSLSYRGRGPKPSVTQLDGLLLYMISFKV